MNWDAICAVTVLISGIMVVVGTLISSFLGEIVTYSVGGLVFLIGSYFVYRVRKTGKI